MISYMSKFKRLSIVSLIVLIVLLMESCENNTLTPSATAPIVPSLTPFIPTPTPKTATPTSIPTTVSPLPVSAAPDGLRLAYVVDGNLFIQDGSKPPLQLTLTGKNSTPVFSDDGERLVFYHGLVPHDLYTINLDGTQEKALVTGDLLASLGHGYNKFTEIVSLAFVPGTHQILFNTRQLSQGDIDSGDINRLGSKANLDLLSINTDIGKIKRLLPQGKGGNFYISPDASTVAIQASGHVDVITIDGHMLRRNLVTYTPTHPYDLSPKIFWNADSTGLSVTLPERDTFDMSGPETLRVGRYRLEDGKGDQVEFDPPVLDGNYGVSPDGNWILYFYFYYPGKTDETIPTGFYLGNLQTGESKFYSTGTGIDPPIWSVDSRHFVFDYLFLGVVDGSPVSLDTAGFLGWVDPNHYIYVSNGMIVIGDVGGETKSFAMDAPQSAISGRPELFTFHFQDH